MKRNFTYEVLEGDAKTVGRLEAQGILESWPGAREFYANPLPGNAERLKEGDKLLELNERWCPGLNEEIAGFAEELAVRPESVVYYTASAPKTGNCSHFALLPDRTTTGSVLCGRSYEWSLEDEMTLRTVRIPGKAAHVGFSVFVFGRYDGVNEHGVWVSMSAANPAVPLPETVGLRFWTLLRAILDRASSVEDAIEIAKPFPLSFHLNLIVADKTGHAALIEKGPDVMEVKTAGEGYLFSTNHYTLPATKSRTERLFDHSLRRARYLDRELKEGKKSAADVRKILSAPFPNGLVCHYYNDWFGTLWSAQADLATLSFEACFGPPDVPENRFMTFGIRDKAGRTRFETELPDETAKPETWAQITEESRERELAGAEA
jgi:predicted choloylglycine hydrolase